MLYNEHLELLLSFVQAESSYDNAIRFYFDLSDEDDTDDLTIRFLSMTPEEKKEWIIERTKYAIRDYRRTKFLGKEIDYSLLKNYKELNEEKDILTQEKKRWVKEIDSYIEGLRKIIDDDKERAKLAYEDFQKKQKQIHTTVSISRCPNSSLRSTFSRVGCWSTSLRTVLLLSHGEPPGFCCCCFNYNASLLIALFLFPAVLV